MGVAALEPMLVLLSLPLAAAAGPSFPWMDAALPREKRLADLVGRMTTAEKLTQLAHKAPGIARVGLPGYVYSGNCNHGEAGPAGPKGPRVSTVFPQSLALAESWDLEGIRAVGRATADEARAEYNAGWRPGMHSWGPNVNICRDSRWGRCQETSGEDPHLSATIAAVHTDGLTHSPADPHHAEVAVVCKHYDVYGGPEGLLGSNAPGGRFRVKVNISERVWRETHLPPFEACLRNGALGIMCSYSAVAFDGSGERPVPSCANTKLIRDELRGKLGFDQHVVGDCGALSNEYRPSDQDWAADAEDAAAKSMAATTDLECEGADGPTSVYGNVTLAKALQDSRISIE